MSTSRVMCVTCVTNDFKDYCAALISNNNRKTPLFSHNAKALSYLRYILVDMSCTRTFQRKVLLNHSQCIASISCSANSIAQYP